MSQQPQSQPQTGQPGPQGQAAQPPPPRMLRPENLKSLPVLNSEEIVKYEEGLRGLWQRMSDNPPDSAEHILAKNKISDFSRMVFNKIQHLQRMKQQQAQQSPTQSQAPGPSTPATSATAQSQTPQAQQAQPMGQPKQASNMANTAQRPPGQANLPVQGQNAGAATAQRPQPAIPKSILDHVNAIQWQTLQVPQNVPPEQAQRWVANVKQKYLHSLMSIEQARLRMQACDKALTERGESLSVADKKKITDSKEAAQRSHQESGKLVTSIRAQINAATTQASQQRASQQNAQSANNGTPTGPTPATSHPMQAATASVTAAMQSAKNQQMAAANSNSSNQAPVQQSQPQQQQQPPPPPTQQNPPQPQQQTQPPPSQAPGTPSTTAPPQASVPAPPVQQPHIKPEPGAQQQPPPVNTAMNPRPMPGPILPGPVGTPTQARAQTPQSATTAPSAPASGAAAPGAPAMALSHAAAVNRANSSTNVTGQQSVGTPNGPASATASTANQTGHPHAHPQPNSQAITAKMPIPKNLPEKAMATPVPVTVGGGTGPGRPTYSGGNGNPGGVMAQPVIAKHNAALSFDADSEHVLSKKKLDELVRQVCGGAPSGTDGNYLTPDVEESVLQVADNFIDTVINAACRLAKERGSGVLEIRDLQLAVERIYNIRIPGYSSEELRTVRKIAPNNNWIAKMSAVQAAKVMPGTRDDK